MIRPRTHFEPKREELARQAFALFAEQGYERTSVSQIMEAAGLTRAGMYHYFASKEEILDAAIDYGMAEDVQRVRADLEGLSVEQKMLAFTRGSTSPGDLIHSLQHVRVREKDSYAGYRIRERNLHAYIPLMEEIVAEGTALGVYQTAYPRQAAEILVLVAKALVETNLLPETAAEDQRRRAGAFLELVEHWLRPPPAHLAALTALFEESVRAEQ